MNIGIIGLGLIGGSMAKAIKQHTDHMVLGYDCKETVLRKAMMMDVIDDSLTDDTLSVCDILILALYPHTTIEVLKEKAPMLSKHTIVVDCAGVKEIVCNALESVAEKYGFQFVGGHPMAGVEYSGFEHSQKTLFKNASMILTPFSGTEIQTIERLKRFFLEIGFGHVELTTAKTHDRMIAFTSQLAHVVSSAYVKSSVASSHKGFSAGSYRDMTRVAKLDPDMWTELFLANKTNLAEEIKGLIRRLEEYQVAIESGDEEEIRKQLVDGNRQKIQLDGKTSSKG
ncbi:MAG: prephenate dehydrogenase/arogenate dehydrogenase family protein [Firmicutes bacterium HGW-Firmicutes-11]|nr:MAG: prephenate dehydrogenase/arogenate dehydrogenase family protein [Firmicutes bacterium HGW-Firmicutes-11]